MVAVEEYGRVRRADRDGMSIRAIARTLNHSRRKVRKILANPEPKPYTRNKDRPAPKLDAFKPVIDDILEADERAPRKQRHTAAQIFRCLRDQHDYRGGYDQVRRYVGRRRQRQRETFIPLAHDPGRRLECDFGHIYVDFPEGRRQVPVLLPTWAYSYCPFAIALPTERTEANVDKFQTVRFDTNRYSTPRNCAFKAVTVKGYIDHVEVVAHGQTIARHDRCYGRQEQILDPIHYLVTLGRRPATLDHTNVYRHWQLPSAFMQIRERLEQCHGSSAGARQYVRVLQLLAEHPVQRVQQAIEHCGHTEDPHAERIIQHTHHLAELASKQTQTRDSAPSEPGDLEDVLLTVQVPLSGLSHFDQFLSRQGESVYA